MKRSRLLLLLAGLALGLSVTTLLPMPKASATVTSKPAVLLAPKPLPFGLVTPGQTSDAKSVQILSTGFAPAAITTVTIASPFSKVVGGDGCTGQTLTQGQYCYVQLNFTPPKKGKYSKVLKVSVSGVKTVFKVTLSGTGSLIVTTPTPTPIPTHGTPTPSPTPTPAPTTAPTTAGDALILGGYTALPVIYDPTGEQSYYSGNSFANGVSGGLLPENFQSVALPDGTVLIAGGDDGSSAYANAYIYNPSTQIVTPVAPMNSARTQFSLTLLNDGEVLAAGGSSTWVNPTLQDNSLTSSPLNSAEIYNPTTKTWTNAASLTVGRLGHAATLLPNGTVLVTGGLTSASLSYAMAEDYEIFTPPPLNSQAGGSWVATSTSNSPNVARYGHAAVLLDDGSVLLAGGLVLASSGPSIPAAGDEHFVSGSWSLAFKENDQRYNDAVVKLANGDVLIAGGIDGGGNILNTAEIFSATGLNWTTSSGTLQNASSGQTAALMADGRVLIAGGTSPLMESYDHSTDQFTPGGSLPSGAFDGAGSAATVLQSEINVMPVGAGPGIATNAASAVQNVPYVSIRVCVPGTTQCRVVNGVVLDTGSTGLRLFASKLQGISFTPLTTSSGQLGECFQFAAGGTWGPVAEGDIYMGGQLANSVPFQIIDDTGSFADFDAIPENCTNSVPIIFSSPSAPGVGFNGILGVGPATTDNSTDEYYSCGAGGCTTLSSITTAVANPVNQIRANADGESSPYYNGISLTMNPVPLSGQGAVYGSLAMGVGNNSADNTPSSGVQVFQGNSDNGGAILTNYKNAAISGFLDSGSNGIFFNDSSIKQCSSNNPPNGPWYCPSSTIAENAINEGSTGSSSSQIQFEVGNALSLIENDPDTFAMPELAGPFGSGQLFDWGLPFFYGRTVYLVFEGNSARVNSTNEAGPFFAY